MQYYNYESHSEFKRYSILSTNSIIIYSYLPVLISLSGLLSRLMPYLNHWKARKPCNEAAGKMFDIYDGKIWQKILEYTQSHPDAVCLSLTLNVDWFQPYEHVCESLGAMYLVINNLPRHLRFKSHNIIIVGLIPGPKEPENINPYLGPLVEELKELSSGVTILGPECVELFHAVQMTFLLLVKFVGLLDILLV